MSHQGGLDTQRRCHEKRIGWEQNQSKSSPPPRVFVHGVKDASHLLMLDNYQEFNAAMIIASGGEADLPPTMPRPAEFVCNEVASATQSGSAMYMPRSNNVVLGEEDAAAFFRGGLRFNKKKTEVEEEEKKVE